MAVSSRRAKYLSVTSLCISVIFFAVTALLGRWSGFFAVGSLAWVILCSALIWFVLLIQFHQRSLAEQEKLDMSQMAKDERTSAIFEGKKERATLFAVAQRRLQLLERWFIPIFSALIAVYQIVIGVYLYYSLQFYSTSEIETKQPLLCAVLMTAVAFVSFLLSRYATGLSTDDRWKPLRAGGSSLFGDAVLCFLISIGLALVQFKSQVLLSILNYTIPVFLIVIGVETALNVVLDIYRPRIKGQYSRAAFDSRLLGIINEPGEILHTAAGAIDYQFGFKVSQTWFYKLLEKAIIPLVLFSVIILYLLSCIVVVNPDEQAIIELFGNPLDDSSNVRLAEPGLRIKWPWPIEIAYKYPVRKIHELYIGYQPKIDPKTGLPAREWELLWGKEHYEKEHNILVASRQTGVDSSGAAVPVGVVKANIPVQYRVKKMYDFLYNHSEPERLLESICYRELALFAASSKVEVDTGQDVEQSLLGAGRSEAKRVLTEKIQAAADAEGLGVEITFVGLQGIHPPPELASDYQKVIGAVQKKKALILDAHTRRNSALSKIAGSVDAANELYDLAVKYDQAKKEGPAEAENAGRELDTAFTEASGDIFEALRKAESYSYEKAALAEATGKRFSDQLKAFRASEEIYKRQLRLSVLKESLNDIRKYVVVADTNDMQVFIVDVQEKLTPSLYDITGLEAPE